MHTHIHTHIHTYTHIIHMYIQVKSHEMDSLWDPVRNSGGHIITLFLKFSYLMDYILLYGRLTSCNNFVYQKTLIYDIYPRLMTKVNVSATVGNVCDSGGMSATVGEMSTTVEEMSATVGKLNML